MLTIEPWERVVADAASAANEKNLVEGVDGADSLPSLITQQTYDENELLTEEGIRRLAYLMLRAFRATPSQWTPLQVLPGWTTDGDGRPAAAWRRLIDGRIQLQGRLTGSTTGPIAGPLPIGARPGADRIFTAPAAGGALTAQVLVGTDGVISLLAWGTSAVGWLELEPVVFDLM